MHVLDKCVDTRSFYAGDFSFGNNKTESSCSYSIHKTLWLSKQSCTSIYSIRKVAESEYYRHTTKITSTWFSNYRHHVPDIYTRVLSPTHSPVYRDTCRKNLKLWAENNCWIQSNKPVRCVLAREGKGKRKSETTYRSCTFQWISAPFASRIPLPYQLRTHSRRSLESFRPIGDKERDVSISKSFHSIQNIFVN